MSKDDILELEGVVLDLLPSSRFKVELENGVIIHCYLNGKLRKHFIRIAAGDKVLVELSVYDLSKGRISRRL